MSTSPAPFLASASAACVALMKSISACEMGAGSSSSGAGFLSEAAWLSSSTSSHIAAHSSTHSSAIFKASLRRSPTSPSEAEARTETRAG